MKISKKINILAFGAHPDDVEACAGGLMVKAKIAGLTTGVIDLTRGEAANTGTVEERDREAIDAKKILGLSIRENLQIPDEHVYTTEKNVNLVVDKIRQYKADILLFPYWDDLHPDHAAAGEIGKKASFLTRIKKYITDFEAHQPQMVLYYMLHTEFQPSFVLDVSAEHDKKMRSILAHKSQFLTKDKKGYTNDYINPDFVEFFESRSKVYGYKIGVNHGEPYLVRGYVGIKDLSSLTLGDIRSLTVWKKQ